MNSNLTPSKLTPMCTFQQQQQLVSVLELIATQVLAAHGVIKDHRWPKLEVSTALG